MDTDSLLPPHKRLLAGLKKQAPDSHSEHEFRRMNLLSDPNISIKEIAEASNVAATKATENAEAKKAHAEQKAAKAAKAVAAAKCALELVANLKDSKFQKRSKSKKHVHVEALYGNCGGEDEEMARDLHRSINGLPRVSKRKKAKCSAVSSCSLERNGDVLYSYNGDGVKRIDRIRSDEVGSGKKRGRVKVKKVALSVCSLRDETSPGGGGVATCREDANNVEVGRVEGRGMCVAE